MLGRLGILLKPAALVAVVATTVFATTLPRLALTQQVDSRGRNLAGQDFGSQQLARRDFSGAILRGASFRDANLKSANLRDADLRNADLRGADLTGADLSGADLRGAKVAGSLNDAILSGTNLEGVDFRGANASQARFAGANLRGTRGWGNITRADFAGADLSGADLTTASVHACSDGLFSSARADAVTRWPGWLSTGRAPNCAPQKIPGPSKAMANSELPARPTPLAMDNAQHGRPDNDARAQTSAPVREASNTLKLGSGRDLRNARYSGRTMEHEDFRAANLEGADLKRTKLKGSDLQYANLRNADLRGAFLTDADLTGADLRGADLERARFVNAKLVNANLEDQVLHLAGSIIFIPSKEKLGFEASNPNLVDRNNGSLTMRGAILRNARVHGDLTSVDLRRADLRGADMSKAENLDQAVLRGAIYDTRTRWNIDPDRAGCVRGEDYPIGLSYYHGGWVLKGETGNLEMIEINAGGGFEWSAEGAATVRGQWQPAKAPGSGEHTISLQEKDRRWTLARLPDPSADKVMLMDDHGKRVKDGRRPLVSRP